MFLKNFSLEIKIIKFYFLFIEKEINIMKKNNKFF